MKEGKGRRGGYSPNIVREFSELGSNHLVSLFINELTFYLIKVSS